MSASLRTLLQSRAHVTADHPATQVEGDVRGTCAPTFPIFYFLMFYIVGLKNELLLMSYLNPFKKITRIFLQAPFP